MSRSRNFVFTINNYNNDDIPSLDWKNAQYIVYQFETGEEGTPHIQGYVQFNKVMRLSALKKINKRAHWEVRRGTHDQARDYCMKEDSRMMHTSPVELGECKHQGARNDIAAVVDMAKDVTIPLREIVEEAPEVYVKYHKAIDKVRAMYVPARDWKTEIFWYHGPTGTGKSRKAFEEANDPYVHNMSNGKWFDGYIGQEDVIFDDMRKDTFKFHELLRLFDRYEMKVEIKGAQVNWCPKRIFVTTCFSPEKMYDTREDLQQLMRRIEHISQFGSEPIDLTIGAMRPYIKGFHPNPERKRKSNSTKYPLLPEEYFRRKKLQKEADLKSVDV